MHYNKHGPTNTLYFSSIFIDTHIVKEINVRKCSFFDTNNTNMAEPDMEPRVTSLVYEKSHTLTYITKFLNEPLSRNTPTSSKSNNAMGSLDYYMQLLAKERSSELSSKLIFSSRRNGTNSVYSSSWNKWASWCEKQKIDSFRCALKWVLVFLADLFEQDYEYRSVCSHRSTILAFHQVIDGKTIGEHPKVSALITRIFNRRPT